MQAGLTAPATMIPHLARLALVGLLLLTPIWGRDHAARLPWLYLVVLAFAVALGHHPDLLVLDEPTSGVDPLQRARLWETIRASAEDGAGVLVSTHHMSEAEQCDRLLVLANGRVAAEGTMDEVVGGTRAVEVRTGRWEEAFTALDAAGLPVSLVGKALRVPGADREAVGRPLAGAGVDADLGVVPASFEEAFVVLAAGRAA